MEAELESQLQAATRQQLLTLVRELAERYPQLHQEMSELLLYASSLSLHSTLLSRPSTQSDNRRDESENTEPLSDELGEVGEIEEDWDFSSDKPLTLHPMTPPALQAIDYEVYHQRLQQYAQRLEGGESPQSLFQDLNTLLEEAETRAEQHDYQSAIDLYALIIDERLSADHPALVHLLDKAIDDVMPILETLLSEVSSNIFFDSSSLTPLMPIERRQQWLMRLFALWLKRLDAHYLDESIPEMMLNMAWSEDVLLLRRMVQEALQQLPLNEHSNIVDFSRQYRTRTLERFLKELPHSGTP